MADFEVIKHLGKGAFGQVLEVVEKRTQKHYALKIMEKKGMLEQKNSKIYVQHAVMEKQIMTDMRHRNIVQLHYAFQTSSKLYMVIDLCPGGTLYDYYSRQSNARLDEMQARFIIAECVLSLEYIHSKGYVHRDIKPENVLLTADGHCKMADFGLSTSDADRSVTKARTGQLQVEGCTTLVGTPNYMAPEIILRSGHGAASDWWSIGILLYELLCSETPFDKGNPKATMALIAETTKDPYFPSHLSASAIDLIKRLLTRDQAARLGYGHDGAAAIKIHPFFRVIDWNALANGKSPSPLKLEDLGADMPASASSKAKAKQAIQSRAFAVPPVTQSVAEVFQEFDFMGSGAGKPKSFENH